MKKESEQTKEDFKDNIYKFRTLKRMFQNICLERFCEMKPSQATV